MNVMKRYCDFDYDNNTIILFDATDGEAFDDLNITWISSGSASQQRPENQPKKEKVVPFPEYIEDQYRKKVQKEKEHVLRKNRLKQKQKLQRQQQQQQQQRRAVQLQQAAVSSLHAGHARVDAVGAPFAAVAAQHAKLSQQQMQAQAMLALQAKNYQKMMKARLQNVNVNVQHTPMMMKAANLQYTVKNGANARVLAPAHSLYSR